MIFKFYEINKIDLNKKKFVLFYGKNEGLKSESIIQLTKNKKETLNYEEREILDNSSGFIESSLSKSLFENEKVIIIKRVSDKILKTIEDLYSKNIKELIIILNADYLDKKSKLRSFFEKNSDLISVAFYPDDEKSLLKLAYNFFKNKNVSISSFDINNIVSKSNGSRENLINELNKIYNYIRDDKKINTHIISKLINLNENYSISDLVDNCLVKNKKKIINILNENNFSSEDCVLITRTYLNKSKRILYLAENFEANKNMDLTISSAKPPIFWKDKEITKQQISKWPTAEIKTLIFKLSELELKIKKNMYNSVNLLTDFILDQASS